MIVKFLANRGGGSAGATMDYLLGKDRDREGAYLISGDPELTQRIADNLEFTNRYTVGVLSFEEKNLATQQKQNIMQSFEESLLAGLDKDQYDITWIEHTDKDRLELNFVIPNVELSTGKRLQPYYDQADRPLVENWKQTINHQYGLTDPHAPDKAQAIKTLNSQNLPKTIKDIKQQIGTAIAEQISTGVIQNQKDVIQTLEHAGFEIARQTDRSISIKNPDGKRNIRLEGIIYENRQFDQQFAKEHSRAGQEYQDTSRERYQTAHGKLQRLTTKKFEANREHFRRKPTDHQRPTAEHQKSFAFEYTQGHGFRRTGDNIPDLSRDNSMARLSDQEQATRTRRDTAEYRADPTTSQSPSQSENSRNTGQEIYLDHSQKQQESGRIREYQRPNATQTREVGQTDEQRLHESLQRHFELVRTALERAKRDQSKTERADRSLNQSESSLQRTERGIKQSQHSIEQSQQTITRSNQYLAQKVKIEKTQTRSRGMER